MRIILNGQSNEVPVQWRDDTLLNVLREHFQLTGAKFGCGVGLCGACTVIVNGGAARSCTIRVGDIPGALGIEIYDMQNKKMFSVYFERRYSFASHVRGQINGINVSMPEEILGWFESRFPNFESRLPKIGPIKP